LLVDSAFYAILQVVIVLVPCWLLFTFMISIAKKKLLFEILLRKYFFLLQDCRTYSGITHLIYETWCYWSQDELYSTMAIIARFWSHKIQCQVQRLKEKTSKLLLISDHIVSSDTTGYQKLIW